MAEDAATGLSWERTSGTPEGTGISLSGGGLRAASFSLGVLQVLQERRELTWGPRAARFLSAVSGGSYTAAALVANAKAVNSVPTTPGAEPLPPLALDTPEEQFILTHGRYLVTQPLRAAATALWLGSLNFASFLVLLLWIGVALSDFAVVLHHAPDLHVPTAVATAPLLLLLAGLFVALLVLLSSQFTDSPWRRAVLATGGIAGLWATLEPGLYRLVASGFFDAGGPWWGLFWSGLALMALSALVTQGLRMLDVTGWLAVPPSGLAVLSVRATGLVLTLKVTCWYMPQLDTAWREDRIGQAFFLFVATLLGGYVFGFMPSASLHREYRERIRTCFGVTRSPEGADVVTDGKDPQLSSLSSDATTAPTLLISATLNAKVRRPGKRARMGFDAFVFGPESSGVPGSNYYFDTKQLELGTVPRGLSGGQEPLVTLFTAVAATGAAASPAMGRMTLPSARPILTLLNIRLGRWLPNPTSSRARSKVASRRTPGRYAPSGGFGRNYNELIPELLGISSPQAYVSDGGHYDNLGLLTLLRARCAEIWCVDSSPDKKGACAEISRVLKIAESELRCTSTIDLSAFKRGPDGCYSATAVTGVVHYDDGSTCELTIIKLGLTADSDQPLHAYRHQHHRFPHHATGWQWYPEHRMKAYRDLGRDSTAKALGVSYRDVETEGEALVDRAGDGRQLE